MDSDSLRNQAAPLFALALRARKAGKIEYADKLIELASDALSRAEEFERPSPENDENE
jgi:cellobiose-specific phosphotransferase system component IIA